MEVGYLEEGYRGVREGMEDWKEGVVAWEVVAKGVGLKEVATKEMEVETEVDYWEEDYLEVKEDMGDQMENAVKRVEVDKEEMTRLQIIFDFVVYILLE